MRMAFFRIKMGRIERINNAFLQAELKTKFPTIRTEIKRAKLERMPLHCFATSMSRVGSRSMNPCLSTGTEQSRSNP